MFTRGVGRNSQEYRDPGQLTAIKISLDFMRYITDICYTYIFY
jgi:hypothetical protein